MAERRITIAINLWRLDRRVARQWAARRLSIMSLHVGCQIYSTIFQTTWFLRGMAAWPAPGLGIWSTAAKNSLPNIVFSAAKTKTKNVRTHICCTNTLKLQQKQFHMKDTGKSSSRKLRRVIYYLLYRMNPQKTHYKISCSATMSKLIFLFF